MRRDWLKNLLVALFWFGIIVAIVIGSNEVADFVYNKF